MYKAIFKYFLFTLAIISCNAAIASGRGSYAPLTPLIVKTSIDKKDNVLVINGQNFGTTLPTVVMDNQLLKVQSFSNFEVTALLPSQLANATYGVMLTITGTRNRTNSNLFRATHFK